MASHFAPGKILRGMWTLADAQPVLRRLSEVADRHGYILSLYGSVMRHGQGHDLDVILVPWRPPSDALTTVQALASAVKGELGEPGHYHYANACIIATEFGPIDVQVRPHEPLA